MAPAAAHTKLKKQGAVCMDSDGLEKGSVMHHWKAFSRFLLEKMSRKKREHEKYPCSVLQTMWLYLVMAVSTPLILGLAIFAFLLRPFIGIARQQKVTWGIQRLWMRMLLSAAGAAYTIEGLENLDKDKNYVFVANHQSNFDPPLFCGMVPIFNIGMAKDSLFWTPFFGLSLCAAGSIFINRKDHEKAMKSCEHCVHMIKTYPRSLFICPEGTRSRDGSLQPFKKGGIILAMQTGLPIVPVAICGTHELLPRGSATLCPRPVKMIIGKPIDISGYTFEDRDTVCEMAHSQVRALLSKWTGDVSPTDNTEVESLLHCFKSPPGPEVLDWHGRRKAHAKTG